MKFIIPVLISAFMLTCAAAAQNKSVYTSTNTKACKTIESSPEEAGSYEGECKGVGVYKIRLLEGDIRQTLDILSGKKRFELNFWHFFSGFSSIGEKIEWRTKNGVPVALIARFNVSSGDDSSKNTSYLMISKIGPKMSCVTDTLGPVAGQNEKARVLAVRD